MAFNLNGFNFNQSVVDRGGQNRKWLTLGLTFSTVVVLEWK